jgi:methionyl-tRNA synthetase
MSTIKPTVSFFDFSRLDFRVGTVVSAQAVQDSRKLLKLQVDLGSLGQRQVLAGIGKVCQVDSLPGRQIIVVANLEPKELAGEMSGGMILAASDEEGRPVLYQFDKEVPNGVAMS